MKIVIVCQTMTYLSGSPLYNYTLALELKRQGHEVDIVSVWVDNYLRTNLEKEGIRCLYSTNEIYDLAIVSQKNFPIPKALSVINVVHSEYDCETPIAEGVDHWVAIRPSIKEHIVNEHSIDHNKVSVIYNGVDLDRFKPIKKSERDYIKVVIPATIDPLREKFLNYYTSRANEKYRVYLYGKHFGGNVAMGDYVYYQNEISNIENEIADADIVAGILLGRVNLEARACDVKSYIHNPDNPEEFEEYYPDRKEFEERHDIKNVAKKICQVLTIDKSQS